ncbi:lipase family protein [Pseudonocardia sp. GCM10023141]|uniref:lipase family protein n=1 Tax=Pseudonocardia sp. GCM10023141 TaxID=3252653 RepID=UPI0036079BA4
MTTQLRIALRLSSAVLAAVATTVVATACSTPSAPAAAAAAAAAAPAGLLRPDDDPFYVVPPTVEQEPDGKVLNSRELPGGALAVPAPAKVWQLLYKTRDNAGRATATVGTLLIPTDRWPGAGPRPLLSYQQPEDGLATVCAPSYMLRAGATARDAILGQAAFDREQVAAAVRRGWAVMVPDYEGPHSEFLGAAAAAHGVLDGVRAASSFAPAGIDKNAPIGLWGYSGGGFATAATAQLQAGYAPELPIKGIAIGGVPADVNATIRAVSGKPYSAFMTFGLAAIRNTYPQSNVNQYLSESARAQADVAARGCLGDAVAVGTPNTTVEQFEASPGSLTSGPFADFAHSISLVSLDGAPSAPTYMYHGTADELLPVEAARQLAAQYRSRGANLVTVEHDGRTHGAEQTFGVAGAVNFLDLRFAENRS